MSRIQTKQPKNIIDGKSSGISACCSEQYPWFSFKDMTTNSSYNLKKLPHGTEREKTLLGLFEKLNELSSKTWLYWHQNQKALGLETMRYDELSFSANSEANISKETSENFV